MIVLMSMIALLSKVLFSDGCDTGWFGSKCQYKCHCKIKCHISGDCQGPCEKGWFGYKCQYRDVALADTIRTDPPLEYVADFLKDDRNDLCVTSGTITIQWSRSYFIFLTRIVAPKPAIFYSAVRFLIKYNHSANVEEANITGIIIHQNTLDIYFSLNQGIDTLILQTDTVFMTCSLWVSTGRNVALKQNTEQSSTDDVSLSSQGKAVDGDKTTCSRTNKQDERSFWTITFEQFYFLRNVQTIFDELSRDKFYSMTMFDERRKIIYHNPRFDSNHLHERLPKREQKVQTITVRVIANPEEDSSLGLCEFEAYAECPPMMWGLECNNDCNSSCTQGCRTDDGLCSDYCLGYLDPPLCTKECDLGLYGMNCVRKCPDNCKNQTCHHVTGKCHQCVAGYLGKFCDTQCATGFYGDNCTYSCSVNCRNQTCDASNGQCLKCIEGHQGLYCEEECNTGFYGDNCTYSCSVNCRNQTCDASNGQCLKCIEGHQGLYCEEKCNTGFYGDNCTYSCSVNCRNQTCDASNGQCLKCIEGHQGLYCEE
ncbi:hypothetical protein BgiMline_014362, partial [Biomphalaria glabrata]